jgi:SAM-dependent methyltransferase
VCNICGVAQTFTRGNPFLREGYRCSNCKASLRYRGQADALIRTFSRHGASTIADLAKEASFAELRVWEPGVLGPFRKHFRGLPNYVMSDYWPDVAPGDERDGIRCEDLMALTFPSECFDLCVTSDIFEHVRHPLVGFTEIARVLAPGGRHIFSIPIQEPWSAKTVERVDTSGPEDVPILEPCYHLGPGNSLHIVYNDFGRDLLDQLAAVGLETQVLQFESPSAEASRLLTLCSTKR